MAAKLIKCKTCGAEIAANAKACPQCGAKNKKPIYKKWWFYFLIVVIVVGAVSAGSGGNGSSSGSTATSTKQSAEPISYTHYDVTQLFDDLKDNALKAKEKYNKQYVEIEGYLQTIDSDGKYISVSAGSDNMNYLFDSVHCNIKNDEQKKAIMEMSKDDPIIVRGRITEVGEVLGYYLDIDSIG